jgi:hypothetical protein
MYDPKGESASTTRAAIANASSNAIRRERDEQVVVGMIRYPDRFYCGGGPALVVAAVTVPGHWHPVLSHSSTQYCTGDSSAGSGSEAAEASVTEGLCIITTSLTQRQLQ